MDQVLDQSHEPLKSENQSIWIGNCQIANRIALAPMAGITGVTYRRICHRFGAGLVVTELVSARGIRHDPKLRTQYRYLEISPDEQPVAIQLFGADPEDFAIAIERILTHPLLSKCSLIDINAGCPVHKVSTNGSGSALLLRPEVLGEIMSRSVAAAAQAGIPVTAKIRIGWDRERINASEIALRLEAAGASAVFVHGRTRDQLYSGTADWGTIATVKRAVRIPVYGNGDVCSPEDARRMIQETGVDGVMIGRAALGNPWIFRETAALLSGSPVSARPTVAEKIIIILEHIDGLIEQRGEEVGVREMRKHLAHYLRGTHGVAALKKTAMIAATRAEVAAVLDEWYREQGEY